MGDRDEAPVVRNAARVLLIDGRERVLLFRTHAASGGRALWITPGGGLKRGETHEAAARRELWEETGISTGIGPCVWVRQHVFRFNGRDGSVLLDEREQIFVARIDRAEVENANWEPEEHDFLLAHRWWSVDEIAASKDWFAPRRLAALLPAVIAGAYGDAPFDCGV